MKKLHLKYEGKKTGRVRISVAKRMGGFMLIICLVNSLEERFLKFPNVLLGACKVYVLKQSSKSTERRHHHPTA